MGTFASIRTRVQTIVIDLPTAVQNEVPSLVNEAIRSLQNDHNFKVMEAQVSAQQTVVATRTLTAVPSNFKEFRGKPYLLTNLGEPKRLQIPPSREELVREVGDLDEGEPRYLLVGEPTNEAGAANFEIWPLPDGGSDYGNGEYRIYIPYYKYLADLSADGDTNWFTVNAENYIIPRAAAFAFRLDWDFEKMQVMLGEAEVFKREVIQRDKKFRLSSVSTFVPHYQGVRTPYLED